ncbi:ornithine carbamoyltransferase [Streptomyces sp. FT05W]|jgi:ornithine carbamoyltransferase|uniref:Aspartate/ornithine carbamoyltransferase Asp/Orn-binding region n=2 Tax=Streptomyces TaxID=1883 RepID=A0A8D3WBY7_STRFA|nr:MULTISPECIES: ornithine carbamoyltransferase [Streptomyces]MDF9868075.1 ornithine carbamoyltransferase [Streptomyces pratensis]RAS34638.1 ornithine carbamoyltransferase [Streptomyces avidinii]TPN18990.1 ornithine carbamoyltransferase [Mesorhizobium sp. B2-3-3]AGJ59357.1 ornithine carbamoyltransferase [Streptomyces sp. PAMC 26508]MCX4416251.1 ornithine carbamoyltransferase [[Kitasatospora] papulosa]
MPQAERRHLISIDDLSDEELRHIALRGAEFSAGSADDARPLADTVVGVLFRKTSTRTRTAFSAGALRLGARLITYGPGDLQENTGETVEDSAAVLSRMIDVLVARTAGPEHELRAYAAQRRMAVVNAMSQGEHPTQALADLTTLLRRFGRIEDLHVIYVGEGNNTASALALALSRFPGTRLTLRTPPGYGVAPEYLERAAVSAKRSGARIEERHDMADLPAADVVYTTRWQTTGTVKPTADWREVFAPFQVTEKTMASSPDAVFMHDLPAHRGEEVTADVLDGPASIAFDQAENKYHSARAVLEWCAADRSSER